MNIETLISRGNNLIPHGKVGLTCSHTIKPNNMPTDNIFDFLQQSASAKSDYVKLKGGDKRSFRLLSKPVAGYELFVGNKPVRWEQDAQRPDHAISDERPKKFVAFIVYEYGGQSDTGAVKVWSFTQRSIIDQMFMLFKDDHWTAYELVVTRIGDDMNTKYNVTGIKSPIEETLLAFCAVANKYVDLSKMFTGDNPFIDELPALEAKQQKSEPNDLPF